MRVGKVQEGTSQQGNQWRRQEVVIEFFEHDTDMWSEKIVLQLRGDMIDLYHLQVGDKVRVRFGLNFNEWNGKFYQEIRLAQDGLQVISRLGDAAAAEPQSDEKEEDQPKAENGEKEDDLPFRPHPQPLPYEERGV